MGSDTVWAFVLLQPGPEQIPGRELNLDDENFNCIFLTGAESQHTIIQQFLHSFKELLASILNHTYCNYEKVQKVRKR